MPDPDADILTLCSFWISAGADANSKLFKIKRRVEEFTRDETIVTLPEGTLEAQGAGYEWNDNEVIAVAPALVKGAAVTFTGSHEECERALSLVLEEVPGMMFDVTRTVDHRKAGQLVTAGGAVGSALKECRTPKPAKVVIRETP